MNRFLRVASVPFATLSLGLAGLSLVSGCSSVGNLLGGDKIDYKSNSVVRSTGLEVPPDLTQLSRDSKYQQTGGAVSAASFQTAMNTPATPAGASLTPTVAPQAAGDVRLERVGGERFLRTAQAPEQLWPQIQAFWKDRGFVLVEDQPAAGVMETDWAENRAKLPQDIIRSTIGRVFDNAYSTGEMDKFRTRVERNAGATEIYITHRGMVETYVGERRESTAWQPRPADPQLESELLSRLMLKLGAPEQVARAAVDTPSTTPTAGTARARVVAGQPTATLQVDDGFDRAWRRVGVALDRSGFTVEDRDRTQGVYFVRYVDPKFAGRDEPNLFQKLFSFGKTDKAGTPQRYRVVVKSTGNTSTVTVLDGSGSPENGEPGKRITALLLDDLK